MKRDSLSEIAALTAIVVAVGIVIVGAIVAIADRADTYSAGDYLNDAALAGFILAATTYALRSGVTLHRTRTAPEPTQPPPPVVR